MKLDACFVPLLSLITFVFSNKNPVAVTIKWWCLCVWSFCRWWWCLCVWSFCSGGGVCVSGVSVGGGGGVCVSGVSVGGGGVCVSGVSVVVVVFVCLEFL